MMRTLTIPALLIVFTAVGCGEDPAANVPKAETAPAKAIQSANPEPAKTPEAATNSPKVASEVPTPSPASSASSLAILPETSKIEFIGSKKVGEPHNGGFKAFKGTVDLVSGKPEVAKVDVDIDTTSIFSDAEKLTEHLKTPDFFDVAKYPTAKFVTTEIRSGGPNGATHTLVGNLTLHGVTKSITVPATVKVEADAASIMSEFSLTKSEFGMTFTGPGGVIRDDVVIKLDVKAAKKA